MSFTAIVIRFLFKVLSGERVREEEKLAMLYFIRVSDGETCKLDYVELVECTAMWKCYLLIDKKETALSFVPSGLMAA